MKHIWGIAAIMVCVLFITSCNKVNRKSQNNNEERTELTVYTIGTGHEVEKDNKTESSSIVNKPTGDGTIDDPYLMDSHYDMNLEVRCQIPEQGEESEIVLEIAYMSFDEGEEEDYAGFEAYIKCLSPLRGEEICIDDYISLLFYNDKNQEVGKAEYLHNSDSDSDSDRYLIFNWKKLKGTADACGYGTSSEIAKAAIRYYDGKEYKEIFLERYPYYGGINNPIKRWDTVKRNDYPMQPTRLDNYNIRTSTSISIVSFQNADNKWNLELGGEKWIYAGLDEEEKVLLEPIKPKDYITVSFYDQEGKIGDSEYLLTDKAGDSDVSFEEGDNYSLYLTLTDKELEDREPTMVAIRYYDDEEYKQGFLSLVE